MKEVWTYKKLGDIASYVNGFPFKPTDWVEDGKPIIRIQNLTGSQSKFNRCSRDDIPSKYFVKRGDILISWSATLGVYEWELEDALLNQHIFKVVFDKIKINKSFFRYAIIISLAEMGRHTNGATMKHIRKGDFDNIEIPIPSLAEQERIVERLDAAFAQIDELKSNAERQLAEARALFQSALTQAMQPKPGWQEKKIKDIADVKGGKRVPKGYKLQSTKTNHPYIRVADFNNYGTIEMSDIQYISDEIFEQIKNYTITDQDLYVSIAGTIGKTGIIPSELNGANLTENACKLVFKDDINLRFVYLFTLSEIFKKQVEKATKQASQPKLALTRLAEVKISVPSIIEQQQIVSCLDFISNHVKELEEISRKTAAECDAMKQALLRQIFE